METTQIQDKTLQTENKNLFKEGDTISGSQALLDALVAEGVYTIFGYPGGAIMPIYDALYDYKDS
jgi:acetolactate synthase-1/2/3 large subunit